MIPRSLLVWLGLLFLAFLNGGLRNAVISPYLGERAGHVLSTVLLCAAILVVTWMTVRWMGPLKQPAPFR